jgi:hypothetical protein
MADRMINDEMLDNINERFPGPFITPVENPDYVPSFLILKWQAEICGYDLIKNTNQLEDSDEPGLPF